MATTKNVRSHDDLETAALQSSLEVKLSASTSGLYLQQLAFDLARSVSSQRQFQMQLFDAAQQSTFEKLSTYLRMVGSIFGIYFWLAEFSANSFRL